MSTLNWGDLVKDAGETASGGNYEPLPDGDYDLKVIEASATTSQSGKTMFKITTEVQVGPHAKRRVWDNLVISPESSNALGIFFSKMAALGLPREFFTNNNPTNAQIESMLVGRTFRAQIGSRTWNGSKRNELKRYYVQQTAGTVSAQAAAPAAPVVPPAPPAPSTAGVAVPPAPPAAPF
jgi:hypothetical protein